MPPAEDATATMADRRMGLNASSGAGSSSRQNAASGVTMQHGLSVLFGPMEKALVVKLDGVAGKHHDGKTGEKKKRGGVGDRQPKAGKHRSDRGPSPAIVQQKQKVSSQTLLVCAGRLDHVQQGLAFFGPKADTAIHGLISKAGWCGNPYSPWSEGTFRVYQASDLRRSTVDPGLDTPV